MSAHEAARAAIRQGAREHFSIFAQHMFSEYAPGESLKLNWHIEAICHRLQLAYEGKTRRLMICLPPRSLKTYLISIAFPAWVLGKNASTKFICASYNQPLAENFSLASRRLMQSKRYRDVFPKVHFDPKKASATEVVTTAKGGRLATSVGGTLTGRGGDFIIVDDPMKAEDAESETERLATVNWFKNTASSRLDDPNTGRFIIVAQRLHVDDLPGTLIGEGGWDVLEIPMVEWTDRTITLGAGNEIARHAGELLHPERVGKPRVAELKKSLGSRSFEAQYNQRPLLPGGAIFKSKWFRYYEERPKLSQFDWIVQSWDTAQGTSETHDYTATTVWGRYQGKFYLLSAGRARLEFWQVEKKIIEMKKGWHVDLVVVESQGIGKSLAQNLRKNGAGAWLKTNTTTKSKEVYAHAQTSKFERGDILFPADQSRTKPFIDELLSFPNGKHDDMVDATTLFLRTTDQTDIDSLVAFARQEAFAG